MWILIVLGSIVALIALVFVVGSVLPERYRASGYVDASLTAAELWPKLLDYKAHPMAARMAKGIEPLPDENGLPVWLESLGATTVRVRTVESEAPVRIVREMSDSVVPMTARAVIELEEREGGCRVRMSNDIMIRRGTWHVPVFRLMMTVFCGVQGGIKAYLAQVTGAKKPAMQWQRSA